MKLCHGILAALSGPEVLFSIRPALGKAGMEKHDGAIWDPSILCFKCFEIRDRNLVITVGGCLAADIDDNRIPAQLIERKLVNRLAFFIEMDGRIEMRAAVLGCRIAIGSIEVAFIGVSMELLFQGEGLGGWPVERLLRKRMRQVNPLTVLKRRCKRITKADGREDGKWDNERRITFSHISSLWHGTVRSQIMKRLRNTDYPAEVVPCALDILNSTTLMT